MVGTAYFVNSIPPRPRAFTGSFQYFVDTNFSKFVCISVCRGGGWGQGIK